MRLSNKTYDVASWMGKYFFPALAVFYKTIAPLWNLPYSNEIPATITAFDLLWNTCLGLSSIAYYKDQAMVETAVQDLKAAYDVEDVDHQLGDENGDSDKG